MDGADKPKSQREWMIRLNSNIERLSDIVTDLKDAVKDLETKKIASLETRMSEHEKWKNQMDGIWKAVIAFGALISIASMIVSLMK